jgi:putative oxidoreductase
MFMAKFETQTYVMLRIVAGFLFLWPGSMKLFNFPPPPEGITMPFSIVAIAGPIEFFGGILIMIGLWTRWVAFLASGLMAFAYWIGHGRTALLPIDNHGELAVIYCFLFLYISAKGSGVFSVDHFWKKKSQS